MGDTLNSSNIFQIPRPAIVLLTMSTRLWPQYNLLLMAGSTKIICFITNLRSSQTGFFNTSSAPMRCWNYNWPTKAKWYQLEAHKKNQNLAKTSDLSIHKTVQASQPPGTKVVYREVIFWLIHLVKEGQSWRFFKVIAELNHLLFSDYILLPF